MGQEDVVNVPMPRATFESLQRLFARPLVEQLTEELAEAEERYEVAKAAVEAARAEVSRRQQLDDHLPQFNDPVTISPAFPIGRFSPLNLRNKVAFVQQAEGDLAAAEYDLETAVFHVQRLRKALQDAKDG